MAADIPLQAHADLTEDRFLTRLGIQLFQLGAPPLQPTEFQGNLAAALAEWRRLCVDGWTGDVGVNGDLFALV